MKQSIPSFFLSLGFHVILLILLSLPAAHKIVFDAQTQKVSTSKPSLLKLIPVGEIISANQPPVLAASPTPAAPSPSCAKASAIAPAAMADTSESKPSAAASPQFTPKTPINNVSELSEVIEHQIESPLEKALLDDFTPHDQPQLVAENVLSKTFSKLLGHKAPEPKTASQPQKQATLRPMTKEERAQAAIAALLKKEPVAEQKGRTVLEVARKGITPTVQARKGIDSNYGSTPTGRAEAGVAGFKRLDNDMRYASYQARVSAHIATSHRVFMNHLPEMQRQKLRSLALRGELEVGLNIVINKDGTLKECSVVRSSGDPFVDEIFLKFQRFIAPYPRIPDHLNISTFRISGDFHFPL